MNGLSGFTLSEFGTSRHHCCRFMTVSFLIHLQWFDCSAHVTFYVLFFPSFFNIITSFPLSMSRTVGILLEIHATRIFPLSFFGWEIDGDFQHQRLIDDFIDEKEAAYRHRLPMSYACYPFSSFLKMFNISRLMGAMSIERSETRVEAYYSYITVSDHIAISCNTDYVLCVWCFNGNINLHSTFGSAQGIH